MEVESQVCDFGQDLCFYFVGICFEYGELLEKFMDVFEILGSVVVDGRYQEAVDRFYLADNFKNCFIGGAYAFYIGICKFFFEFVYEPHYFVIQDIFYGVLVPCVKFFGDLNTLGVEAAYGGVLVHNEETAVGDSFYWIVEEQEVGDGEAVVCYFFGDMEGVVRTHMGRNAVGGKNFLFPEEFLCFFLELHECYTGFSGF